MKISLHRALSQIKTTAARLEDLFYNDNLQLVDIADVNGKTSDKTQEADVIAMIQGSHDKFNSMYSNLFKLKSALAQANAGAIGEVERFEICGSKYTIAELIILKSMLHYEKDFIDHARHQLAKAKRQLDERDKDLKRRIDSHVAAMSGGDKKNNSDEVKQFIEFFTKNNEWHMIDPLKLEKMIEEKDAEYAKLVVEIDSALDERNALTLIDVDLTDC